MALASPPIAIAELAPLAGADGERMADASWPHCRLASIGVDRRLPGGGLALGHLHEVIEGGPASEYARLRDAVHRRHSRARSGPVLWCLRGRDLFAPALARIGLHPDRVIYCETWKDGDVLPAMEEGLRCTGLAGVVGEVTRLSLTASRRLQLCAGRIRRDGARAPPLAQHHGERFWPASRTPLRRAGGFHRSPSLADGLRWSAAPTLACRAAALSRRRSRIHGFWRHAMRRVISLFLPRWPSDRLRRKSKDAPPRDKPLVTAIMEGQRRVLASVDEAAERLGLALRHDGDARAIARARSDCRRCETGRGRGGADPLGPLVHDVFAAGDA